MLQPKKVKYRRSFRGKRSGVATRGFSLEFGDYGMKSTQTAWITARQIESARRAMTHYTKRGGKLWIRVFPSKPVSKKPPEVRMGSGKALVDHYVTVVKPGTILFELGGVDKEVALEAMKRAAAKLPINIKFISGDG